MEHWWQSTLPIVPGSGSAGEEDSLLPSTLHGLERAPLVEEEEERWRQERAYQRVHHASLREQVMRHIQRLRRRVGLEEIWSIDVLVCCPQDLPEAEASIWWHEEVWYARLQVRCTLSPLLLEWCVCHELCELSRWRSANCFLAVHERLLSGDETTRLLEQYRLMRNQEIELQVAALLGHRRPAHIVE